MTRLKLILAYMLLTLGAITMLVPFGWMILTSLQPGTATITTPQLTWPTHLAWDNYLKVWHAAPFARYCLNSVIVTFGVTAGQLVTSILAAFAFTHLQFYGRRILFYGLIALMMVPGELLIIPNFVTMAHWHWIDTYAALIVPFTVNIFAMFAVRQAFSTAPKATYYAARLDGASDWQYLWQILVPANRATLTAITVLQLIGSWNAFMWPLIVTNTPATRPLSVGLITFTSETGANYPLLMAATVLVLLPLLLVYFSLQKYIIAGITRANLKG